MKTSKHFVQNLLFSIQALDHFDAYKNKANQICKLEFEVIFTTLQLRPNLGVFPLNELII